METVRHLVAGTDFSACARQALNLAVRLAARVTVVHVCEPDAEEQVVLGHSDALCALVAEYRRAGAEIDGVLRCGLPWKKLDNVATEVGASLIVIGRHGAGHNAAIGSVADKLFRSAHRSLLIVDCDFDCLGQQPFVMKEKNS